MKALQMATIAEEAAKRESEAYPGIRIQCHVLGVPRQLTISEQRSRPEPGCIICQEHERPLLLCAPVSHGQWLCHPLSPENCPVGTIFHIDNLVQTKIMCGTASRLFVWEEMLPGENGIDIAKVVAFATWQAEQIRSKSQPETFDMEKAAAGFERDPFKWHSDQVPHQLDFTEVTFAWILRPMRNKAWALVGANVLDTETRLELVTRRMDNALQRGVPSPEVLFDSWLHRELLKVAGTAPLCEYLGVRLMFLNDARFPQARIPGIFFPKPSGHVSLPTSAGMVAGTSGVSARLFHACATSQGQI